ncbi:hypothetical protein [Ferrimonas aestuarii]|uniref:Uncharacterized protein n=1 Tax=Ferrimonas aestuarii TaxID=2569539 RepID=A0A4V5NW59_9GAMM|nr:hypothetical protein [Ferrimonas aestuarii]TKB53306.1 hypothetical protein FCL42_14650 [Ferrimonas aestuarii]
MARNPKQFDCDRCPHRHCSEEKAAQFDVWVITLGGFEHRMRVCPKPQITAATQQLLSLFGDYRQGYLLNAGGLNEQPFRYLQAMRLIDSTVKSNEQ